ncbi:high-affinity iron transporter [Clostridium saccharobutylicum]|uniref:FTR1 family iron permease n=5 Tax=Clostridium saccharobutylicum TaxID=169679 RepID=UPI001570FF15|nr:FTR1 family protein [Clostridium saccharobutylicum]NSB89736.1 high-affinity iron transporter [Clostridium saccharobutylicum]
MRKLFTLLLVVFLMLPMLTVKVLAADAKAELSKSNEFIEKSLEAVKVDDFSKGKDFYEEYNQAWIELEDGVKEQSKQAYGDIEGKMGMVKFLFSQDPVQKDKVINALEDLEKTNKEFIEGRSSSQETKTKGENTTIKDLVELLEKAKSQIESGNDDEAVKTMDTFSSSWLDVEGVVLTKSKTVYDDAERDMVSAKAYLTVDPIQKDKAVKVIDRMHGYLSLLDGNTSYGIVDVITIILREGLEALLVVIALLGFLKKSDQEDKKSWIYGGVIIGSIVSIVLAVLVKLLFTSGTFGNNNFLISGWTGVFAAVMLIYVSYWLHSKSSVDSRNHGIQDKSCKSLANGSLFSLGFLAFLAVFREGTEVVLFYIGMASSIKLTDLFLGIALGFAILIIIAVLMLKIGLRIPMKPFFLVSSLLVFYLGLKFTGMGINGLQLSGVLPATSSDLLPTISALAVYPTWQGVIPQAVLVVIAILVILHNKLKRN